MVGPQKNTGSVSDEADPQPENSASAETASTEATTAEPTITEPTTESTLSEDVVPEDTSAQTTQASKEDSEGNGLEEMITPVNDTVTVAQDSDVLDYPGRKDGNVIGEVLEYDVLTRTGTIDGVWSQVVFSDEDGEEQSGYIPSSVLEGYEETQTSVSGEDGADGSLHAGSGSGVFTDALDGVTSVNGSGDADAGVVVGTPVSASADASLVDLGVFQITHYCPCSICCGPYANGITATGVTAVTNHTIAVDPTVIPYGSKVVINGQVYVAEDCGSAIQGNRIDIYVGSHAEGEEKGTFNTEVYLLQEN